MTITWTLPGRRGSVVAHEWPIDDARYVALLLHGYGEHLGRYLHVAQALGEHGALVVGPDHLGHGRSEGERVLIEDVGDVVADAHAVWQRVHDEHPDLPTVLIGHSMGGHLAARYAQEYRDELSALVLSAPMIGRLAIVDQLLPLPEIPDIPLDPDALSRDPEVGIAYAADPLVWHGPFQRPTLEAFRDSNERVLAAGDVGDLPVLWIHGTADPLLPLDDMRVGVDAVAPSRTEQLYDGGLHESFNETNSADVLAAMAAWIDERL